MKHIFLILGVCYVAFIVAVATSSQIVSGNRVGTVQGHQDHLERKNYRGDGYSQRLPGSQRSPKAGRQFGWRPEYLREAYADAMASETGLDFSQLEPNCLILWTADWCSACKKMYPIIKKLEAEGYTVHILDYDKNKKLAARWNITKLPTTLIRRDSVVTVRHVGIVSVSTVKKDLKKNTGAHYDIW